MGLFSQVGILHRVGEKNEEPIGYDSTTSHLGIDFEFYKGQTIFAPGLPEERRNEGYGIFMLESAAGKDVSPTEAMFDFNFETRTTDYKSIAGKYFLVRDCFGYTDDNGVFKPSYFLTELESGIELIWQHEGYPMSTDNFPFYVVGHIEKLKKDWLGRYVKNTLSGMKNIETGDELTCWGNFCKYWKVVDLLIDDSDYNIWLIVENEYGEKSFMPYPIKKHFPTN